MAKIPQNHTCNACSCIMNELEELRATCRQQAAKIAEYERPSAVVPTTTKARGKQIDGENVGTSDSAPDAP